MTSRLYKRMMRVSCYRASPGQPGGFVSQNPQFFETLPNAIVIDGLRVQINVEKHTDAEPNKADVVIYNCNEQTRAFLEARPLTVRIDAGYDDNLRHVFTGNLRHGYSTLAVPNWETHLQLADGDRAWRYARVNRAYKKGTTVATVLQDAAKSMGLIVDGRTLASPDLQAQFASGRTLQGATRDELTRLLGPYGYQWSMQDGRMQILKDDDVRQDQAQVISEDTGLIGSPEFTSPDKVGKPAALRLKSLLFPELTPGARIVVRSRGVNGTFRMERVTHDADTHDDSWHTEIEAKPSP
jgi:hypothetical protein